MCTVPDNYKNKAKEQGKLTTLSYETKMTDGSGKVVKKEATVYLPYGYNQNKKYDFVYLSYGSGANKNTFLGNEKGEIKPIIIVTPTYTEEYKDYYIYAASGNHDFMNEATEKVVEKLQEYPEQFQITATNFTEGNLLYTSFDGYHRYYYSNPYMYNGLRRFLGENK